MSPQSSQVPAGFVPDPPSASGVPAGFIPDYAAQAAQHGGTPVDYAALAAQHGGVPEPLPTPAEFAQRIKAKYPVYAQIPDEELVAKVIAKYPVYARQIKQDTPSATPMNFAIVNGQRVPLEGLPDDIKADLQDHSAQGDLLLQNLKNIATVVGDVAIGAGKSLVRSGIRGGALLRKIPGVDAAANALPSVDVPVEPANTAQRIGGMAEQVAEVAAPSRAITALGTKTATVAAPILSGVLSPMLTRLVPRIIVEAGGTAALAKLQGASNSQTGVTAALAAAMPTAGAVAVKLADKLRGDAIGDVYQFFNPTTKGIKGIVAKRTSEILDRGSEVLGTLGRNRESAVAAFGEQRVAAGEAIDDALTAFGAHEVRDAPQRLQAALDGAKAAYVKTRIATAAEAQGPLRRFVVGTLPGGRAQIAIPLNAAKVKQIDALKQIVQAHGDAMTVDDLVGLRRAWDEIAYAKPGFGEIGPTQSAKWAKKMGGDAIRGLIGTDHPDLAALNREFSFWKDLETAMDATVQRKVGQVGGIIAPMAEGGGRVVGAVLSSGRGVATTAGSVLAIGKIAKLAQRVFASPRYLSLAAHLKQQLAEAITSGSAVRTEGLLRTAAFRIGAVEAPRVLTPGLSQ